MSDERQAGSQDILNIPTLGLATASKTQAGNYDSISLIPGMLILAGYLLTTFVLTHINLNSTSLAFYKSPSNLVPLDKVYHLTAYCGLTLVVMFAFTPSVLRQFGSMTLRSRLVLCGLVMAYGVFDEVTQPLVGRNMELADLLANSIGITIGHVLYVIADKTGLRDRCFKLI